MKILIAPDSFKESLSALQAARAIASGLRRVLPEAELILLPMADGGEGTVEALLAAVGGRRIRSKVSGPLGDPLTAAWGLLPDGTAVIEMAAASGLVHVPGGRRNPLKTTSFGTGQLMQLALARGARRLLIGLGGSATNDCGAGMAQALGVRFLDVRGRLLKAPLGGGDLQRVARIDLSLRDQRLAGTEVLVACDVDNPLVGPRGASCVYGPQKGASPAQVLALDAKLRAFGKLAGRATGTVLLKLPGAGAAGGLGAGLLAFAGGRLVRGGEMVNQLVNLEDRLRGVDLVVTGEGRMDAQTRHGKTPASVAAVARQMGVPVVGLAGSLSFDANVNFKSGFDALMASVTEPVSTPVALAHARRNLVAAAERLGHWLLLAHRLPRR